MSSVDTYRAIQTWRTITVLREWRKRHPIEPIVPPSEETMCQHDATYAIENEANGGIGCPICRRAARVVAALEKAEAKPVWFVNPLVIIDAAHEQADEMVDGFHAAFPDERGRGCAGNSADDYDSSTEGHW